MGFFTTYVYDTIDMSTIYRGTLLLSRKVFLSEKGVAHKYIYM